MDKICPMREGFDCIETACSWFNVRRGNCAVICISCDLDNIETALRERLNG